MSCTIKCLRICLIVFNSVVFIAGAVMCGFGIFLLAKANEFGLTGAAIGIPAFITIIGFIILGVGFLGCCGAIKLSRALLFSFSIAIGLIILAEIVGGVLLIIYKDKVKEGVANYFREAIKTIEGASNQNAEKALKKLQQTFRCCGAYGPSDWREPNKGCCKLGEESCSGYPQKGCVDTIYNWIKQNLLVVAAVVLVLSIIEIGAIVAACCIIKQGDYA